METEDTKIIKDQWKKVGKCGIIGIHTPIFEESGANSVVYHGWYDDKDVAVKMVMNANNYLSGELDALRKLEHENIVRYWFKDQGDTEHILFIVLEKCDCTLKQYVDENRLEIDIKPYEVLRQTTKGLHYLHNEGYIHRDLKPSNILLVKRGDRWLVKISDFGISKQLSRDKTSTNVTSISGTNGYIAPEIMKKEKVSKKSDIFSLGIVFHYVLSGGDHPFAESTTAIVDNICDEKFKPSLDNIKQDYACETKKLIGSMIEHDVAKRVDVRQVKSHHIFWKDPVKRMIFIVTVSNFLQNQEKYQHVINELEKNVDEGTGENWRDRLMSLPDSTAIRENLEKKTKETHGKKIYYLLRVIRNWKNHLNDRNAPVEFKQEATREFGPGLEGILKLFPKFLSRVYDVMWSQRSAYEMHTYFGISMPELPKSSEAQSLNDMEVPAGSEVEAVEVDSTQQKEEAVVNTGSQKHTHGGKQCVSRKITLYEYQKELAKQALDGDNSMIIAPTGSGKTAVAFAIIEKRLTQLKDKLILFFVSKCILARQQYHFLKSQLPEYAVGFITGREAPNIDVGLCMHENNVTVLTPQILINELIKEPPGISFSEISLMVFDECHHATGNHPYKIVMDMFLDSAQASIETQIVGMTASPGVGQGSRVKVLNNLFALLAGLNITRCPVTVTENLDELRQHLCEAKETCFPVESTQDEFMHKLLEAMSILENSVTEHVTGPSIKGIDHPPKEKEKQVYKQWTRELHKYAALNMDGEKSYLIKQLAQHLNTYYDWLTLKNIIPNVISSTMMAHEDRNLVFDDTDLGKKNQELMKLSKTCKVPMLETLVEILKTEFTRKPDGRCIIFVERKLTARCLAESIRDVAALAMLRPEYLFSGRECSSSEMTRAQHMRLLDAFSDGDCKLLVSTSVAEEGLDIAKCNLVISYDYVTGEVGRIQRAGRGRDTGSKFILIATVGGGKLEREKDNEIYSKASENAIADIREEADDELREKILNIQKKKKVMRALKTADEQSDPKDNASDWKVICPGSKGHIITVGVNLRYVIQDSSKHLVVKDSDFESCMDKVDCSQPKGPVLVNAEYFCKNCREQGQEKREKLASNITLPNSNHAYIALCQKPVFFQHVNGEKVSVKKKGKKIPFEVQVWEDSNKKPIECDEVSASPALEEEKLNEDELREVKALVDAELS